MPGAGALFIQLGGTVLTGLLAREAAVLALGFHGRRGAEALRQVLNRLVLWVTMPALVFQSVHSAPLDRDLIQAPAAAIAGMGITAFLA